MKKVIYYCLYAPPEHRRETPLAFCNFRCGKVFYFPKNSSTRPLCQKNFPIVNEKLRVTVDMLAFNIRIMTILGWSIDEIYIISVLIPQQMCGLFFISPRLGRKITLEWHLMWNNGGSNGSYFLSVMFALKAKRRKERKENAGKWLLIFIFLHSRYRATFTQKITST